MTSEQVLSNPYDPEVTLEHDFMHAPVLEGLITDTHFSQRDRMGRLITFMSRTQADQNLATIRGLGVDEKTAVLVEPEGEALVVGQASAHFVRASEFPEVCRAGAPLTQTNLTVQSLRAGQHFDFSRWASDEVPVRALRVEHGELKTR